MEKGFWQNLPRPIIGLSPMDGVTDAAMRFITKKYGSPAVMFTEFTSVEGVRAGALRLMKDFLYSGTERPIVAQVFGADPDAFYKTALVVAALGFDGIDINMGCPAKSVEEHGAGAGLIKTPQKAAKIIAATKKGVEDWIAGATLDKGGLSPQITAFVKRLNPQNGRKLIPVSVKTRIGYDKPVTKAWVSHLLEQNIANISLHGRTLKQLYSGEADWDEIAKAAALAKATPTCFLGNGDINSLEDAKEKIKKYALDGVLVGRAAQGNPWFFTGKEADTHTRITVALEHARYYEKIFPGESFLPVRKHLAWYARGFENASEWRQKLVLADSSADAARILAPMSGR